MTLFPIYSLFYISTNICLFLKDIQNDTQNDHLLNAVLNILS